MTGLAGEVIYEAVKFIIMLLLLAGGVVIGGKLRTHVQTQKKRQKTRKSRRIKKCSTEVLTS